MRRVAFLTGVLALLLSGSLAWADEVVVTVGGKQVTEKGTITKDEADQVMIDKGGPQMGWARKDVIKITYDCLQKHYEIGLKHENARQYEAAIARYEDAVRDDGIHLRAKQYPYIHLGQCLVKTGKFNEAAAIFKEFLEKAKAKDFRTVFRRELLEGLFTSYMRAGKLAEAEKILKEFGEEEKALGNVFRAELSERKADNKTDTYANAADQYLKITRTEAPPEMISRAYAGAARCQLLDGRWAEAAETARKVLKVKGFANAAAADAHQVIGESLANGVPATPKELAEKANQEKAFDALEEMMRPLVQYQGSEWAEPRAYYFVGLWCERLAAAGAIGEWPKRAQWAQNELLRQFPKSPWAEKLKK